MSTCSSLTARSLGVILTEGSDNTNVPLLQITVSLSLFLHLHNATVYMTTTATAPKRESAAKLYNLRRKILVKKHSPLLTLNRASLAVGSSTAGPSLAMENHGPWDLRPVRTTHDTHSQLRLIAQERTRQQPMHHIIIIIIIIIVIVVVVVVVIISSSRRSDLPKTPLPAAATTIATTGTKKHLQAPATQTHPSCVAVVDKRSSRRRCLRNELTQGVAVETLIPSPGHIGEGVEVQDVIFVEVAPSRQAVGSDGEVLRVRNRQSSSGSLAVCQALQGQALLVCVRELALAADLALQVVRTIPC